MARDPNAPALAADYDALLAQLATMRDEMNRLAAQLGASAAEGGKALAETVTSGLQDARIHAGRRMRDGAHEGNQRIEHAVAANPYVALGLAAAIGLLLGALTRR